MKLIINKLGLRPKTESILKKLVDNTVIFSVSGKKNIVWKFAV